MSASKQRSLAKRILPNTSECVNVLVPPLATQDENPSEVLLSSSWTRSHDLLAQHTELPCSMKLLYAKHCDASGIELLKGYKELCDSLLPEMRAGSHSHHQILRDPSNVNLVLVAPDPVTEQQRVLAGITWRILQFPSNILLLDIVILAVSQDIDVRGRGNGTRLVNASKSMLQSLGDSLGVSELIILAQVDHRPAAWNFWLKQAFTPSDDAIQVTTRLSTSRYSRVRLYTESTPMLCTLTSSTLMIEPTQSCRARTLSVDVNTPTRCATFLAFVLRVFNDFLRCDVVVKGLEQV
jgi:hypothetical protein